MKDHATFRLGRRPELNGLRGVAVGVVMALHSGLTFVPGGWIGVDVFFVLSGFLITALMVEEYDRSGGRFSFRDFYARRALRLFPALAVLLAAVVIATRGHTVESAEWAAAYAANWRRAFGHDMGLLGHTWSLSVEEQFYLAFPPLMFALLRSGLSRKAVAATLLGGAAMSAGWRVVSCFAGASPDRVYNGTDTRADGLLLGAAVAVAVYAGLLQWRWIRGRLPGAAAGAACAGMVYLILRAVWDSPRALMTGPALASMGAAAILVYLLSHRSGRVCRVLSWGPLELAGRISYGLYLWHYPVMLAMLNRGWSHANVLLAGSGVTVAVAVASYYGLERPILRLKSRFGGAVPRGYSTVPAASSLATCSL